MSTLPSARVSIDDEAVAFGDGEDVIAVCCPVPGTVSPTCTLYSSTKDILDEKGYCQGAAYSALHHDETGLPVLFVAMPVATAGGITHVDRSGVTGTSVLSIAAGADGVLEAVDGSAVVTSGGTVGTDTIVIDLSLDGGFVTKSVRIGTATSYVIPYIGQTMALGAGTLSVGDVITWKSYGPQWSASDLPAVRTALAAQAVQVRSCIMIGDADDDTKIEAVRSAMETYATTSERFTLARVALRDRHRTAEAVGFRGRTVGATLTFDEIGGTGDTITRLAGSWITDGFTVGDTIVVTGAVATAGANNITAVIATLTATVITLGTEDLVAEGPITSATITCYSTFTFAEVGATADTITRSSGSFITDGFKAGMTATVDGSASNDGSAFDIETVTATVLTLGSADLAAEVISGEDLVLTASEAKSVWRADIIADVEDISGDTARRIDSTGGYGAKLCPITGWRFRRSFAWAFSLREYQHDLHIPAWRVADDGLAGWTLEDASGVVVEHDERADGGLLAANISCARTLNNEPGVFCALSLTRANPGSLLSRTHNMYVANAACTAVQRATQREIGQILVLQRTGANQGKATEASLVKLQKRVNQGVALALRDTRGEGDRASGADWVASRADILNIPGATVTGILTLDLNGTIETINTTVRVPAGG
jgi:hypothetical protein